jgi:hypothetical protein
MECLVQGLESNSSLVELALFGNVADKTRQEVLLRFLRTGKSDATCAVRRLHLINPAGTMDPFVSILTPDACTSDVAQTTTSITASLQVLSLDSRLEDIQELLNVLVAGGHGLSSLSLGYLQEDSWVRLTRQLPDVVHL